MKLSEWSFIVEFGWRIDDDWNLFDSLPDYGKLLHAKTLLPVESF